MDAKEMFESVGYNQIKRNIYIAYRDENNEKRYFAFNYDEKSISIGAYEISIFEHKAIHQQMKELGWLDEK